MEVMIGRGIQTGNQRMVTAKALGITFDLHVTHTTTSSLGLTHFMVTDQSSSNSEHYYKQI